MDKTPEHKQTVGERAACSHLRRVVTKMNRSQRLAVATVLTAHCFREVNRITTNSVELQDFAVEGGQAFNEQIRDIRILLTHLPTKDLAEVAVSILLPELTTFAPPS
jgi:hypothetical protein